ncbi:MAG: ester cyclase [Kofleriaceae bacterium]
MTQLSTKLASAIHVRATLDGSWQRLAAVVRDHLGAFLAGRPVNDKVVVVSRETPSTFADDLAVGAPQLHAAFPDLVRRVTAIDDSGKRVTVRLSCQGTHDGAFFGFMMPTGRAVRFEEVHHIVVECDQLIEDRLELDLRTIIRQLAAS